MMWKTGIIVALLSSGIGAGVRAQEPEKTKADTNREVALTYAQVFVEQNLFDEAENALQLSVKNDGENGAILNFLGLIQLRQKKFSQACYSFQTASIAFKDLSSRVSALYNLADCLHQGGRRNDAVRVLKDLATQEESVSDSAEKTLELMDAGLIRAREPLPAFQKRSRGRYRVTGALSSGFDSNVFLVEEDVASGIAVSDRGSFYVSPTVQLGYLGKAFGQTLEARFTGAFTNYVNSSATSFNNLYNRLDVYSGNDAIRWGFFSDLVLLNYSGFGVYNYDLGISWQNIKKTGMNERWIFEVPVRYQKFVLSSGVSTDNDRSGGGVQAKASYRSLWSDLEYWGFGATFDQQYSVGKNYRLSGLTIPATIGLELPVFSSLGLLNTFSAELSGQLYWQSDLNRRDFSYRAGTGLVAPFIESWNVSLDYYYLRNHSNVDAANYSKGVVSLLLSHHFI